MLGGEVYLWGRRLHWSLLGRVSWKCSRAVFVCWKEKKRRGWVSGFVKLMCLMLSLQSPNSDTHSHKSVHLCCTPRHERLRKAADVVVLAQLLSGPHMCVGGAVCMCAIPDVVCDCGTFYLSLAEVLNALQQRSSYSVCVQGKSTCQGVWTWPPAAILVNNLTYDYVAQKWRCLVEIESMCGRHVWPQLCHFILAWCVILCEREER